MALNGEAQPVDGLALGSLGGAAALLERVCRSRVLVSLVAVAGAATLGWLTAAGLGAIAAGLLGFGFVVMVAVRFPVFTAAGCLAATAGAHVVSTLGFQPVLLIGYRPEDVLAFGMLVALSLSLTTPLGLLRLRPVLMPLMVFSLMLCVAMVRNLGMYGLSTIGEFRYSYLVLIIPFYIAASVRDAKSLLALAKVVLVISVCTPLAMALVHIASGRD